MKQILYPFLVIVFFVAACASQKKATKKDGYIEGIPGFETKDEVTAALDRAAVAYVDGRWGDVVTETSMVIESKASPDDFYFAVRMLGLASCNRKDAKPVAFAWKRLKPNDRDALTSECERNGLTISPKGEVTKQKESK